MTMQYKEVRDLVREEIVLCTKWGFNFSKTMIYITGYIRGLNKMGATKEWDLETYDRLIEFKNELIHMWFE